MISCCQKIAKAVRKKLHWVKVRWLKNSSAVCSKFSTKRTPCATILAKFCYWTPDNYYNLGCKSAVKRAPSAQGRTRPSSTQNSLKQNVYQKRWKPLETVFSEDWAGVVWYSVPGSWTNAEHRKIPSIQFIQTVLNSYRKQVRQKLPKEKFEKRAFAKKKFETELESRKRVKNVVKKH